MTTFFNQIRRYADGASLVKELSDKLARLSGVIEDGSASLRKMRVDTSKITYAGTSAATLDGADNSKSDSDAIAYADTEAPGSPYTYATGTFKVAGGEFHTNLNPLFRTSTKNHADFKGGQFGFMQQNKVAIVNVSDVGA